MKPYTLALSIVMVVSLLIISDVKNRNAGKVEGIATSPTITPTGPSPTLDIIVITETPTPTPTDTPTPTPTITPPPIPVYSADLEEFFTKYASQNSINKEELKKIAYCESGFNPAVRNGDYGGMYQFATGSWISTRIAMNADTNPALRFNAEEAIKTAAFKIATRGLLSWPNCSK